MNAGLSGSSTTRPPRLVVGEFRRQTTQQRAPRTRLVRDIFFTGTMQRDYRKLSKESMPSVALVGPQRQKRLHAITRE